MSTLLKIPRDILSLVLTSLNFEDLLQLHCIGNSSLAAVLQRTTLPPIIITPKTRFRYGSLPAFIQNYGAQITHFELRTNHPLVEAAEETQRKLLSIPNLRTLILHTPSAEHWLVCPNHLEFVALGASSRDLFRQIGIKLAPRMMDLRKSFPKLEKLDIEGKALFLETPSLFVLRDMPHLTSLNWNSQLDNNILHFLPGTLRELALYPYVTLGKPEFPSLPPQLEILRYNCSHLHQAHGEDFFRSLPPSLVELHLIDEKGVKFPSHLFDILPPNLTFLTIESLPVFSKPGKLPSSITTLHLRAGSQSNEVVRTTTFPTNLTRLKLDYSPNNFDYSLLPASLRYLEVIYLYRAAWDEILDTPSLPSGLLEFKSSTRHALTGNWPSGLKSLDVSDSVCLQKGVLSLPTTLLHLGCGNMHDYYLESLPATLTYLRITHIVVNNANITLKLPPALTYFEAEKAKFSLEELNMLPKTLLSLIVSTVEGEHRLDLADCDFPPHLRDLCLGNYNVPITLELVTNLPRTLKSLHLKSAFPTNLFSALPAGLETLKFQSAVGALDALLLELPPRLKTLSIIGDVIYSSAAVYLPRTLTCLELAAFNLEQPHLLPVGLLSLKTIAYPSKTAEEIYESYKGPYDPVTGELRSPDHFKSNSVKSGPAPSSKGSTDRCIIS